MKKTKIIYWIFTGLLVLSMLASAIPEIMGLEAGTKYMIALHYPLYLNMLLGVAKILAVIVILISGYPRLKEWAYAGLCIDLVGATYSQIATGVPVVNWIFMSIWFVFLFGSYIYYHKRLKENSAK